MSCDFTVDRAIAPTYPLIFVSLDGSNICVRVQCNEEDSAPYSVDKSYPNTDSDVAIVTDLISSINSNISANAQTSFKRGFSIINLLHQAMAAPAPETGMVSRIFGNSSDVNAKVTATTTIGNTGDNEFHPMLFNFEIRSASGVLVPATVSVGTNSPNYNNLISLVALNSVLDNITSVALDNGASLVPKNTDIKVRVVTATTGTTHSFRVAILGHLGFQ